MSERLSDLDNYLESYMALEAKYFTACDRISELEAAIAAPQTDSTDTQAFTVKPDRTLYGQAAVRLAELEAIIKALPHETTCAVYDCLRCDCEKSKAGLSQ